MEPALCSTHSSKMKMKRKNQVFGLEPYEEVRGLGV